MTGVTSIATSPPHAGLVNDLFDIAGRNLSLADKAHAVGELELFETFGDRAIEAVTLANRLQRKLTGELK